MEEGEEEEEEEEVEVEEEEVEEEEEEAEEVFGEGSSFGSMKSSSLRFNDIDFAAYVTFGFEGG